MTVPLGVLDLVPITTGSNACEALRNTIDLARRTEELGYARYWFAEHHLNPGIAGTSPAVVIGLVAPHTSRIRLGSGGVQLGHRTALSVVEEFGLLDALHPGRLDLGLGRSGGRGFHGDRLRQAAAERERVGVGGQGDGAVPRASNGLPLPRWVRPEKLLRSPRVALNAELLQQPNAETPDYGQHVREILALLQGAYRSSAGIDPHPVPGTGADVRVWVLGSSGGQSATVAGELGLPFAASYHVSPGTVLDATEGYRAAFRPSAWLDRPYVLVSADAVVGCDDEAARELAAGYGLWVRSIRTGEGAIEFPTAAEAARHAWTDEERALVGDRVQTQFVGSPATVADHLEQLRDATGADELMVTTITHDHADRVRSYELLAEEWSRR